MGRIFLNLIRALAWAHYGLPRPMTRLLARGLGGALRLAKLRRKVIDQNLRIAFPGNAPETLRHRERLVHQAYEHLGELFFEIFLIFGPMRQFCRKYGRLEGLEHWERAHAKGKGVFFLANHVGNWEVMSAIGAGHDMDLMLVTKRLKPDWFHEGVETGRASYGVKGTYEPRTLKDVLAHLKKKGTVGFVLDQFTGAPIGVRVPVFDVPVGTSTALAMLAKRTGAAVLPVVNYRTQDGRYVVRIEPEVEWMPDPDSHRELALNTSRYSAIVERHIREHPEQWLWIHRRFKGDLGPLRENEWLEGRPRR